VKGKNYQPVSETEASIVKTVSRASFPIASGPKRFIGDLAAGYSKQLSDGGRQYLAWIANRFRRQYQLSAEQLQWVAEHIYPDVLIGSESNRPCESAEVSGGT
jgi:hypothetical protein